MDISAPAPSPAEDPADAFLATRYAARLIDRIAAAIPAPDPQDPDPDAAADTKQDAAEMFRSMRPRSHVEAAFAASAVIAHFTSLSLHARAAAAGLAPDKAPRLCNAAMAEQRSFQAAVRELERHQAPPQAEPATAARRRTRDAPDAEPEKPFVPIPHIEEFQPRDRHGCPIPKWRCELMTRAQKLALYGDPNDKSLWETAIAEEEIMIAEQLAQDAAAGISPQGQ